MKQFESFGLDTANECLWRNGAQISLPPKPYAILRHLVENPGRLITHDELLDAIWPETYVQPQVLRTYMLELRKVLEDDASNPRFIQTLPKRGYCFVAAVSERGGSDGRMTSVAADIPGSISLGIVNREEEMARLVAHAQLTAGGARQVVFVTGGPGIGKTALVDAFCRHASSSLSAIVARGQCVEGVGKKEEYYPVMEALSHLCASEDQERACRILARMAPGWLPALRQAFEPEDLAASRNGIHRGTAELCAALEELAQERSLILVFEDVHWADDSTLELISALARRRARAKLMIVATFRPLDGAASLSLKGLRQDLLMRRLCTEVAVTPLNKLAVKKLLVRELGQEKLPTDLNDFVFQRSEGNPLFVIAILEHLVAQGYLARDEAGWKQKVPFSQMETAVPTELGQMIELEIGRLTAREQRILEAASLTAVAFPAWAVAAALDEDLAVAEEACDELAHRVYFVQRAGQDELPDGTLSAFYVFAHGLYREVLYQRQAATRRAKGHVRIAERLSAMFAGREASVAREMAMHFEAAGNWKRTAATLRAAARHAQQRQAHFEAADLLEHALMVAENLHASERDIVAREVSCDLLTVRQQIENAREKA